MSDKSISPETEFIVSVLRFTPSMSISPLLFETVKSVTLFGR